MNTSNNATRLSDEHRAAEFNLDEPTSTEGKPSDALTAPLFVCSISERCPVKKNTQRIVGFGKSKRAIYSPQFVAWQRTALLQMKRAHEHREPISQPLRMIIGFFFKNRQAEADLSNLIEGPQDALKLAGVIADDKLIHEIRAFKYFGTDQPRTEIYLFTIEGEQ